jgi:hypothetical protein
MEKVVGKAFLRSGTDFYSLVLSEDEEGYTLFTFGGLGGDRVFRSQERITRPALEASLPYWEEVPLGRFRAAYAEAIDFLRAFQK